MNEHFEKGGGVNENWWANESLSPLLPSLTISTNQEGRSFIAITNTNKWNMKYPLKGYTSLDSWVNYLLRLSTERFHKKPMFSLYHSSPCNVMTWVNTSALTSMLSRGNIPACWLGISNEACGQPEDLLVSNTKSGTDEKKLAKDWHEAFTARAESNIFMKITSSGFWLLR